jgi:hypothetical protein
MDQPQVALSFLKYIQTLPEKKLEVYRVLLEIQEDAALACREAIVGSSDPILDKERLKAAYNDPDQICRRIAKERIGKSAEFVGETIRSDDD